MNNKLFNELSQKWRAAKGYESAAREKRIEIENQLLELVDAPDSGEGSQTTKTDTYKITAGFGITRTVLQDKVDGLFSDNQSENAILSLVFPTQHKLDLKQLRAVKAVNESLYNKCAIAISAKPRKASFKIETIE